MDCQLNFHYQYNSIIMEQQYMKEFLGIIATLLIIFSGIVSADGGSSCLNPLEVCVAVADDPALVFVGSYITVLYSGFTNDTLVDVTIYDEDVGNWVDGFTYYGSASAGFLVIKIETELMGIERASVRVSQHDSNGGNLSGYYPRTFRIVRRPL